MREWGGLLVSERVERMGLLGWVSRVERMELLLGEWGKGNGVIIG